MKMRINTISILLINGCINHRSDINNKKISLRCSDRKCRGTVVVDNGIKKHSNPHSIAFEDHDYMKLDLFIRKYQKMNYQRKK